MRVLVACEFSQVVCKAFRDKGHEAYSCDLLPTEGNPEWHIQKDILEVINNTWDEWDMLLAFPPCTYLTLAGNRWFKPEYKEWYPDREQQRQEAIDFFMFLATAPIPQIAIENPIGIMSRVWRKPDQIIQPHQFGDEARKATCLWLKNLPPLLSFQAANPRIIKYKSGKGTDSEWHIKTFNMPAKIRAKERSRTFPGIAKAMAEQWGIE